MKTIAYARRKWTDLQFSVKLFIGFLVLCLIPMLIVTQIYYFLSKSNIQSHSTDFIRLFASQLQTTLSNYMTQIENTSRSIYSDPQILAYLGNESEWTTFEKINKKLTINRLLSRFADQLPYVEGVMLIGKDGEIYSFGGYPDYYDESVLSEQLWYRQIWESNGQLVVTPAYLQQNLSGRVYHVFTAGRLIKNQEGQGVGAILFNMTATSLLTRNEHMNAVGQQYDTRIRITNAQGEFIYDSTELYTDSRATESFLTISGAPDAGGLNVTVMVPAKKLFEQVEIMKTTTVAILILSALIIALCSIGASYRFTKPIYLLTRNIKYVEEGYYRPLPHTDRNDEIGVLIKTYNLMILKIKHLIEDVYQAEIRRNEARLLALQNQINPHWLNNTLESIRMKAHAGGAKEVASMIKALGRLFHLALTHNPCDNRIRDEIEHVELYAHLQNIRYENRFSLVIEMDERLRQSPIINLVFQPIVENSIIHGFYDDSKRYTLTIRSAAKPDATVIQIIDDGAGIPPEKLQAIRRSMEIGDTGPDDRKSIGLHNVHERIRLHYGVKYGLAIQSSEGLGTTVSISIPPVSTSS